MEELKKEQIILPSDGEAASIKTITGWVSRKGHFSEMMNGQLDTMGVHI
jgi:hypothetical protein